MTTVDDEDEDGDFKLRNSAGAIGALCFRQQVLYQEAADLFVNCDPDVRALEKAGAMMEEVETQIEDPPVPLQLLEEEVCDQSEQSVSPPLLAADEGCCLEPLDASSAAQLCESILDRCTTLLAAAGSRLSPAPIQDSGDVGVAYDGIWYTGYGSVKVSGTLVRWQRRGGLSASLSGRSLSGCKLMLRGYESADVLHGALGADGTLCWCNGCVWRRQV